MAQLTRFLVERMPLKLFSFWQFLKDPFTDEDDEHFFANDETVNEQTRKLYDKRTRATNDHDNSIWAAIGESDLEKAKQCYQRDPTCLSTRGAVGELPIHLCFLLNGNNHFEIAKWMFNVAPDTLKTHYLGAEYKGESCLHIAIVNRQLEQVKFIVQHAPELIQGRATGDFFTNRKTGKCDYGEFPLSFAVAANQLEIADYLIAQGANMEAQDARKNTALHQAVIFDHIEMYDLIKRRWKEKFEYDEARMLRLRDTTLKIILGQITTLQRRQQDLTNQAEIARNGGEEGRLETIQSEIEENVRKLTGLMQAQNSALDEVTHLLDSINRRKRTPIWLITNEEKLTAFTLSASLNRVQLFTHELETNRFTLWTYGPVTCYLYPLEQIETPIDENGEPIPGNPSALEIILKKGHEELLTSPRIMEIYNRKWKRFGHTRFKKAAAVTLLYLIIFTLTTVLDSRKNPAPLTSMAGVLMQLSYASTLLVAFYKLSIEFRELKRTGYRLDIYWGGAGADFVENFLSTLHILFVVSSFALTVIAPRFADAPWALAGATGWCYFVFYILGFDYFGPIVIMLFKMIVGDFTKFVVVLSVFVMGFSHAFFVIFDDEGLQAFLHRLKVCFVVMLGDFDMEDYINSRFPVISTALLITFILIVSIVLLNLLIAMMGDTYSTIKSDAKKQWQLEWARIISSIENEMDPADIKLRRYWFTAKTDKEGGTTRFLRVEELDADFYRNNNQVSHPEVEHAHVDHHAFSKHKSVAALLPPFSPFNPDQTPEPIANAENRTRHHAGLRIDSHPELHRHVSERHLDEEVAAEKTTLETTEQIPNLFADHPLDSIAEQSTEQLTQKEQLAQQEQFVQQAHEIVAAQQDDSQAAEQAPAEAALQEEDETIIKPEGEANADDD